MIAVALRLSVVTSSVRMKCYFSATPFASKRGKALGNGTVCWGEATDEPAREDARPTHDDPGWAHCNLASFERFLCIITLARPQSSRTSSRNLFARSSIARQFKSSARISSPVNWSKSSRFAAATIAL
jgi:hypothetical protein